jgi:hypothetical protein
MGATNPWLLLLPASPEARRHQPLQLRFRKMHPTGGNLTAFLEQRNVMHGSPE